VAQGEASYRARDFATALAAFERAIALDPQAAVPRYNAGAALFQLGRYREAGARYREARERADAALRTKIDYALGNVAAVEGEYGEAIAWYDSCLASSVAGATYAAVRRDARINRAYAQRKRPPTDQTKAAGRSPAAKAEPRPQGSTVPEEPYLAPSGGTQAPSGSTGDRKAPRASPSKDNRSQTARPGDFESLSSESPQAELNQALQSAREARQRRLAAETPSSAPDEDRKDW
jgi:Ca-activated chloride channel family protein